MGEVTLKDVADAARVSYATVSRAVNDHPHINEQTKQRVLKIAQEMGYQPNAIAQGLVTKKTNTIGLLIPDITNPFFPEVARGIEETAEELGYTVFLCNTNWNKKRESRYIDVLLQRKVEGIIISPSSEEGEHLQALFEADIKNVFLNNIIKSKNKGVSIIIDNKAGAYLAVEHLIKRGNKKVAFIGGLENVEANAERLQGYKQALKDYQIQIKDEYIKSGDFKQESGHKLARELLQSDFSIPEAIFAANDLLALGALHAVKEAGLDIPEDIAIIGFDDIEFASLPEINLSTVAQPKYNMGQLAVEKLIEQIQEKKSNSKKLLLDPDLIIRETT